MRNKYIYIVLLLITGCNTNTKPTSVPQSQETSTVQKEDRNYDANDFFVLDTINSNDSMKVYEYQNLTSWGGLTLKYVNDKLQTIETIQNAELGFTKKIYSIDADSVIGVSYVGHHAKWGAYDEKYPEKDYEWDPSKMTYFDTSFTINYTSDTYKKSNSSKKIKLDGKRIIKFLKEENINAVNLK